MRLMACMLALILKPAYGRADFQMPMFGAVSPIVLCWDRNGCSWTTNGGILSAPQSCDPRLVGSNLNLRGFNIQGFSPGGWMFPATLISTCGGEIKNMPPGRLVKKSDPMSTTWPTNDRCLPLQESLIP